MSYQVGDVRWVKARKKHVCWWCGDTIEVGEVHAAWSYVDNGRIFTIRMHSECEYALCEMVRKHGSYDYGFDFLHTRGCICERGYCYEGECELCTPGQVENQLTK